jgi:hypothetical protein
MTSTTPTAPTTTNATTTTKDAAADAAGDVATSAKDRAASVASTSTEEAKHVAQDAMSHARDVMGQSRDELRRHADEQARALGGTLTQMGDQLRAMGQGQAPPPGPLADVTSQLASAASRYGDRLSNGGFDQTIDDVKRFARRRPMVFLAAAVGAGMVVGRMLRSADTHALMEAAKPGGTSGGQGSQQLPGMTMPGVHGTTGLAAGSPLETATPEIPPFGATAPEIDLTSEV